MNDAIRKLKALLDSGMDRASVRKRLESERREAEDELASLLSKLEQQSDENRWKMRDAPSEQELFDELEKQKSLVQAVRKRLQELDHLLDDIEGDYEDRILDLRQKLIEGILEASPTEHAPHEARVQKMQLLNQSISELKELQGILSSIGQKMHDAVHAWEAAGSRSILHYIFGKNPAIRAANQLEAAQELSSKLLPSIASIKNEHHELQQLYKHTARAVAKFLEGYEKHWDSTHFKRVYIPYLEAINTSDNLLDTHIEAARLELEALEAEIDHWINTHSS